MGKGLRAAIEEINAPLRKAAEEGAARWMAFSPEERQQRLQAALRQLHEKIPEQGRAQLAAGLASRLRSRLGLGGEQ